MKTHTARLTETAKRNGLAIAFTWLSPNLYEARWTTGTRAVAWCGTLRDMNRVAKGKLP